jgi:hypothetical protein
MVFQKAAFGGCPKTKHGNVISKLKKNIMNKMNSEIEIPISKKKTILIIFGSLIFVICCVWLWTKAESQTTYPPIILQIITIVGIAFFGLGPIFGLKKLFDKRPGLIISKTGIQNNLSVFSGHFISWTNIENFEIIQIKGTRIILINVNNAEEAISQESKIKQKIMRFSMKEYGTPYSIGSGSLLVDFDELYDLLTESLKLLK